MALRIYVGADIKAYGISKHQHFTSEGAQTEVWPYYAPQNVREAILKSPGIAHLFVDWPDYMKLRQAGSVPQPATLPIAPLPGPPITSHVPITRIRGR